MKMRRITATLLVLTMLLVCLPMQTRAEEETAILTPKKFEQMKTITTLEEGVIAFTESSELASLCDQAQRNPSKEYLCIYAGDGDFHIEQNLFIPENMAVGFADSVYEYAYVDAGVAVNVEGYIETYNLANKGTLNIYPTGALYTKGTVDTSAGVIDNYGTIVSEGGCSYGIIGEKNLNNRDTGVVQLTGSFYNQSDLLQICRQAAQRNDGHWFYAFESGNPNMPFDTMTITVPSNCSLVIDKPQNISNAELDVYGYIDCSAAVNISGNIRVHKDGLLAIGADFALQGELENYGIIAVVSGVEDFNGSLKLDDPQKYRDVNSSKRGGILIATKAGQEYPAQALAGMNVNSFTVERYQEDGKSFWLLTDYQDTVLGISGMLGNNVKWKLEGDVLTISGTGTVTGLHAGQAPWYDVKEEVKKLVIGEGIIDFANAAFSLNRMTEIEIADTVTRLPHNSFEKCHSLETVTIPASVQETGAFLVRDSGVKTVYFTGDAPKFHAAAFVGPKFDGSDDLTVMYPAGNDTWTEEVRQDYGGNVTWVAYCDHDYVDTTIEADCLKEGGIGIICSKCGDVQGELERIPPQGHYYGVDDEGNPDFWDTTCDVCEAERKVDKYRPTHSMFRMYNPNSGEHFYTGSMEERQNLVSKGWKYEGVGFTFPASTGKPVYRLYDKYDTCEHLYTMDEAEKEKLLAEGWILEGVAFNSGREDEVPQYRLHNPNETIGAYHFTASLEERDMLLSLGWEYQGIGFYTCKQ